MNPGTEGSIPGFMASLFNRLWLRLRRAAPLPLGVLALNSPEQLPLKLNRLVGLAALGTAGAIHVRIVGINEAAFLAADNPVFTRAGSNRRLLSPHRNAVVAARNV